MIFFTVNNMKQPAERGIEVWRCSDVQQCVINRSFILHIDKFIRMKRTKNAFSVRHTSFLMLIHEITDSIIKISRRRNISCMHVSFAVIARRIGICYQRQRGTNSDTNETNDRWRNKTRQRKDMGRAEKEEVEKWPWLDRAAWQSHASWEVCCFSVIADIFGFIEWRYPWHCIRYYCGYYILNYYNYHTFDERLGKWTVKYVKVWFLDRFFFSFSGHDCTW